MPLRNLYPEASIIGTRTRTTKFGPLGKLSHSSKREEKKVSLSPTSRKKDFLKKKGSGTNIPHRKPQEINLSHSLYERSE